jgi:hypothetical protein
MTYMIIVPKAVQKQLEDRKELEILSSLAQFRNRPKLAFMDDLELVGLRA